MMTPPCDLREVQHVLQCLHLDLQRLSKLEHAAGESPYDDVPPVSLAAVIDILRVAVGDVVNALAAKHGAPTADARQPKSELGGA